MYSELNLRTEYLLRSVRSPNHCKNSSTEAPLSESFGLKVFVLTLEILVLSIGISFTLPIAITGDTEVLIDFGTLGLERNRCSRYNPLNFPSNAEILRCVFREHLFVGVLQAPPTHPLQVKAGSITVLLST